MRGHFPCNSWNTDETYVQQHKSVGNGHSDAVNWGTFATTYQFLSSQVCKRKFSISFTVIIDVQPEWFYSLLLSLSHHLSTVLM